MGGLFNYDNPIWRFVGRIWDLFILNLLWVLCSLPIVTFGASTTAMYYCTMKIARDRDSGGVLSMFFHSFKDNLLQSTIIWVIMAFVGGILLFDIRFFSFYSPIENTVLKMIIFTYIFPIQAKFIDPIKQTFKLALFMSVKHLIRTIIILAGSVLILAAVYILIMRMPGVMSMLIFVLGSGISLFQASQFNMIFDKYIDENNE